LNFTFYNFLNQLLKRKRKKKSYLRGC